jgi:VWFA-related protein
MAVDDALDKTSMRRLLLCSTLAGAVAASSTVASQRPEPQPTFRTQVDVMTLDVTVLDRNGVPVEDLRPEDFVVKVGNETRPVISAELITVNRADRRTAPVPTPPRFFSTNAAPVTPRKVMFAVDQLQIAPGTLAPLFASAHQFLDGLLPYDQAAVVAFPPPGPRVQFTTDKARVRAALRMELGNRATRPTNITISVSEALRISDREMSADPLKPGPETARVLVRMRCDTDPRPECSVHAIKNEATLVAQAARAQGRQSIAQLESLLDQLALIDGPKTLVAENKIDRQVVAIAKVAGAETIYTTDTHIKALGGDSGIRVVHVADLPLPPSNTPLQDVADD